jgi:FixJ family two-component response regulator
MTAIPAPERDPLHPQATVYVVDDDASVRLMLEQLVRSAGLRAETFATAEEFLEHCVASSPGCLVVDLRMPGMGGLELQRTLAERGVALPIILLTGYADVATAVRAMQAHAFDVLEKPFGSQALLDRIRQGVEHDAAAQELRDRRADIDRRLAMLTRREREVLDLVGTGLATKQIAARIGRSVKTVEVHRTRVRRKLGVRSLAEIVRVAIESNRGDLRGDS